MTDAKILIKLPSRERPDRFFKSLDSIVNNVRNQTSYEVLCSLDIDDPSMNNDAVKTRLTNYERVTVDWGQSHSKIHAINRSIPSEGWDIICQSSDDICFNIYGFDELIRVEMSQCFPDGDGYLHFREKDSNTALNVMTIIDKKYYDRFGFIYHPDYKSLWCDNEQTETAKILGRYRFINYEIFNHYNSAYNYPDYPKDAMFLRQQEIGWSVDQETYYRRKAKNFDLP